MSVARLGDGRERPDQGAPSVAQARVLFAVVGLAVATLPTLAGCAADTSSDDSEDDSAEALSRKKAATARRYSEHTEGGTRVIRGPLVVEGTCEFLRRCDQTTIAQLSNIPSNYVAWGCAASRDNSLTSHGKRLIGFGACNEDEAWVGAPDASYCGYETAEVCNFDTGKCVTAHIRDTSVSHSWEGNVTVGM